MDRESGALLIIVSLVALIAVVGILQQNGAFSGISDGNNLGGLASEKGKALGKEKQSESQDTVPAPDPTLPVEDTFLNIPVEEPIREPGDMGLPDAVADDMSDTIAMAGIPETIMPSMVSDVPVSEALLGPLDADVTATGQDTVILSDFRTLGDDEYVMLEKGTGVKKEVTIFEKNGMDKIETDAAAIIRAAGPAGSIAVLPTGGMQIRSLHSPGTVGAGVSSSIAREGNAKVIITFKDASQKKKEGKLDRGKYDAAKARVGEKLARGNGRIKHELKIIDGVSADIDAESLAALAADPDVDRIELDREYHAFLDTSPAEIGADQIWPRVVNGNALTGHGITIAIIDTGVDYAHQDLGGCIGSGCKVVGGYDYVNYDPDPMDDNGHGTHVAATAAGKGYYDGIAPDAEILAYKVLNAGGSGYFSAIVAAIENAVDPNGDGDYSDRADIISMSLGGPGDPGDLMSQAVDEATARGTLVIVAAGNSGPSASSIGSPGLARTALTVAASCQTGQVNSYCNGPIAWFSSRGPVVWNGEDLRKPDISAPGVSICAALSSQHQSRFDTVPKCGPAHMRISGTSMATPEIAGSAALLLQAYPGLSPLDAKEMLKANALSLGESYDAQGAGRVDLPATIQVQGEVTANPAVLRFSTDSTVRESVFTSDVTFIPQHPFQRLSLVMQQPAGISIIAEGNVSSDQPSNLHLSITVDTDVISPGLHQAAVTLQEDGVMYGYLPIIIDVKPSLVTDMSSVDFGIDAPNLASWSASQTIRVTNSRTDRARPMYVTTAGLPAGATLTVEQYVVTSDIVPEPKAPWDPEYVVPDVGTIDGGESIDGSSVIMIPPGETVDLLLSLYVDNAQVPNGIHKGEVLLTDGVETATVSTVFTKYYALLITETMTESHYTTIILHNNKDRSYVFYKQNDPLLVLTDTPGNYDIMSQTYTDYGPFLFLVKENVPITGSNRVVIDQSQIKHKLYKDLRDVAGNPIGLDQRIGDFLLYDRSTGSGMGVWVFGGDVDFQFGDISPNYAVDVAYSSPFDPAIEKYAWQAHSDGVSDGLALVSSPSIYNKTLIAIGTGTPTTISPSIATCIANGNCIAASMFGIPPLTSTTQTLHSYVQDGTFIGFSGDLGFGDGPSCGEWCEDAFTTPNFNPRTGGRRSFFSFDRFDMPSYSKTLYNGLGPSYWTGKMTNDPHWTVISNHLPYGDSTLMRRQDYSVASYPERAYTVTQNGNQVLQSVIPPLEAYIFPHSYYYLYPPIQYGTGYGPGQYTFTTSIPYVIGSRKFSGDVILTYDSSKADPNPPYFTSFAYLSDNKRKETYQGDKKNTLQFAVDPNGGSIQSVMVEYSLDGVGFFPMNATKNTDGTYSVALPQFGGTDTLRLRVTATDNSGNKMKYTFGLPIETQMSPRITSPVANTTLYPGNAITIQLSRPIYPSTTIQTLELLKNGVVVQTISTGLASAAPASAAWTVPAVSPGAYQLRVRYNSPTGTTLATGFSGTFTVAENAPPKITFPAAGTTVYAGTTVTVQMSRPVYPSSAIQTVELVKDGVVYQTISRSLASSAPLSFPWSVPVVSSGTYQIRVRIHLPDNTALANGSSGVFSIAKVNALVISPNGGEYYARGGKMQINVFRAGYAGATQEILLVKANPYVTTTISSLPTETAPTSITWTVPSTIAAGSDYHVRINIRSSSGTILARDTSDTMFKIS